jgi:hypothetical protein
MAWRHRRAARRGSRGRSPRVWPVTGGGRRGALAGRRLRWARPQRRGAGRRRRARAERARRPWGGPGAPRPRARGRNGRRASGRVGAPGERADSRHCMAARSFQRPRERAPLSDTSRTSAAAYRAMGRSREAPPWHPFAPVVVGVDAEWLGRRLLGHPEPGPGISDVARLTDVERLEAPPLNSGPGQRSRVAPQRALADRLNLAGFAQAWPKVENHGLARSRPQRAWSDAKNRGVRGSQRR